MNNEDHREKDRPAGECTSSAFDTLSVKQKTNCNGTHNLWDPVHEVIQWSSTDVEESSIVAVEFYGRNDISVLKF